MREVITRSYCLPPELIKWVDSLAKAKSKAYKGYVSASSVLAEILVEAKYKKSLPKNNK